MSRKDPRIDAYIDNAPAYSRPILKKLRTLFHKADKRITENVKWGNPTFEHEGIVGGMGAFKKHVAFGFWNAPAMKDPEKLFRGQAKQSPYAIKAASVGDLPKDAILLEYIREAVALNEQGVKREAKRSTRPALRAPSDFVAALGKKPKAQAVFKAFTPSRRREYVEWILDAKREETRKKRIATAVEWIAEGKRRNWKYEKS